MTWFQIIFLVVWTFVAIPVISYLIAKFGTAGYLRARRREEENKKQKDI